MQNPNDFAKTDTEHGHQVAVFVWAHSVATRYPELNFLFAIPNGGERNKIVAAKLKAEGVKTGVPDLMLPVPRKNYAGLFIEMKRPSTPKQAGGTLSKAQKDEWIPFLIEHYYNVEVCYDWVAAARRIAWYLDIPTDDLPERYVPT